jgi:hypothetical protein
MWEEAFVATVLTLAWRDEEPHDEIHSERRVLGPCFALRKLRITKQGRYPLNRDFWPDGFLLTVYTTSLRTSQKTVPSGI